MNSLALYKIKECLSLASEFVKDENTYYNSPSVYVGGGIEVKYGQAAVMRRSADIRAKAELEASKLEKQEKCAKLIIECLEYLKTVENFENTVN